MIGHAGPLWRQHGCPTPERAAHCLAVFDGSDAGFFWGGVASKGTYQGFTFFWSKIKIHLCRWLDMNTLNARESRQRAHSPEGRACQATCEPRPKKTLTTVLMEPCCRGPTSSRKRGIVFLTRVGFAPTQFALVELESTPLDDSGKVSTAGMTKIAVKTSRADFSFKTNETEHACLDQPAVARTKWKPKRCRQEGRGEKSVQRREKKEAAEKMDQKQPKKIYGIWAHEVCTSGTWVHAPRPFGWSANCWHDQICGKNIQGWFFLQKPTKQSTPAWISPPSPARSGSHRDADKKAEGKSVQRRERQKEAAEKMGQKKQPKETNT